MDRVEKLDKPSLLDRTWFFLFGNDGSEQNPLAREKELLTYARAKKGLITNADIMALLGVTYAEADSIGTRLVATYDGAMDITDDAVAVYRFDSLLLSGAPEVAEQVPGLAYRWQRRRRVLALQAAPNLAIPALNAFNLILCIFAWTTILPTLGYTSAAATFWLVYFPGAFAVVFFGLAVVRKSRQRRAAAGFERDNMRISLYRLLLTRRGPVRLPGDEAEIARGGLGAWSVGQLTSALPEIAEELRGEASRASGRWTLGCPRVFRELALIEELRLSASSLRPVGRTVFSSREPAQISGPSDLSAGGDPLAASIDALDDA